MPSLVKVSTSTSKLSVLPLRVLLVLLVISIPLLGSPSESRVCNNLARLITFWSAVSLAPITSTGVRTAEAATLPKLTSPIEKLAVSPG